MLRQVAQLSICLVTAITLCSCGVAVPQIGEFYDKSAPPISPKDSGLSKTAILEFEIEKKVFCELKDAVRAAREQPWASGASSDKLKKKKNDFLPLSWIAELSLSLEVDESSALNPGVVLNTSMPNVLTGFGGSAPASTFAQSFGLGLGGTLSSTATRTDKFDPYYTVEYLAKPLSDQSVCRPGHDPIIQQLGQAVSSPFVLDSDLGLKDWLIGALFVSRTMRSIGSPSDVQGSPSGFHPDVLTIEIKFIVLSNGSLTPTWKLVRVSANGAAPFFAAGRMRTHDLIITIGPPKTETNFTHLASQIGNSVSNANRSALIQ